MKPDEEFQLIRKNGPPIQLKLIEVEGQQVRMPIGTFVQLLDHTNVLQSQVDRIAEVLCPDSEDAKVETKKTANNETELIIPGGIAVPWFGPFEPED